MHLKPHYLLLVFALCLFSNAYGGFIINSPSGIAILNPVSLKKESSEKYISSSRNVFTNLFRHTPFRIGGHRGIAIALGILGLLPPTLFFVGTHRMYYGYWLIGCIQFLGFFAAVIGVFTIGFAGTASASSMTLGIVLFSFACLIYLWHLVDLIRIITNNLRPKKEWNGRSPGRG